MGMGTNWCSSCFISKTCRLWWQFYSSWFQIRWQRSKSWWTGQLVSGYHGMSYYSLGEVPNNPPPVEGFAIIHSVQPGCKLSMQRWLWHERLSHIHFIEKSENVSAYMLMGIWFWTCTWRALWLIVVVCRFCTVSRHWEKQTFALVRIPYAHSSFHAICSAPTCGCSDHNIITEFTANAATATLFLPLLADVALSLNVHLLLLMIPATFASNFAFMLPVATPPMPLLVPQVTFTPLISWFQDCFLSFLEPLFSQCSRPLLVRCLEPPHTPLSLSFLNNMCSQGFPSFLPSFLLSVCLSTESLFQVLTFDPSCLSCFWLLPRYMGVWTWPTNHPLTFPDHEMISWEEIVDQMQIPAWDDDQSILYKMDSQLPSLDLHKPCPATTTHFFSTHLPWHTRKLLCSLTLMSASAIQLALILSPPFSLLILEVILYASIFPPLLSLKGDWLLDCSWGYKIHLSEKCFLHGRDASLESFWVRGYGTSLGFRVWNQCRG